MDSAPSPLAEVGGSGESLNQVQASEAHDGSG